MVMFQTVHSIVIKRGLLFTARYRVAAVYFM